MEKTNKGVVIPLDAGWSDIEVGSQFGKPLKRIKIILQRGTSLLKILIIHI